MKTQGKSLGDIFFDKYRELERVIQQKFPDLRNNTPIYYLSHKPGYEKYAARLECCREIRNLISHYPKERGAFPIEPSQEMVLFLEELICQLSNRVKCSDAGVPYRNIYWRKMTDRVTDAITVMREKSYMHVPIMDGRKVTGIFDAYSLLRYLADQGPSDLTDLCFHDIRDYIRLEGRKVEIFTFHHQYTFLDELQEEFQRQYRSGHRIGIAFITASGKADEDVLSMLTAWDVLGKN